MNKKLSLVVASILFLSVLSSIPILQVQATETTYSPTGENGTWGNPEGGYHSDDNRALTGINGANQFYTGYGINIGSDTIDKVEMAMEGYLSSSSYSQGWYYTVNGGGSYNYVSSTNQISENVIWTDITGYETWTASMLLDANFHTRIVYQSGGGGCYGLEAEVGLWEGGLRKVGDLQVGDVLTGWNETEPYEIKGGFDTWPEFEYVPSTIQNITIHNGTWEVVRLIMESYYRPGDFKDCLVTPEHLLPAFKVEWENATQVDKIEMEIIEAADFSEEYYVFGYMAGGYDWENETSISPRFEPYKFHNITTLEVEGVADIQTDTEWFMGHYLLRIKMPWTGYLDWLGIRITTSEAEPEPSVSWHCFYIDVNNTVTDMPTRFWSNWADLNASEGLSYYLFSWNITGTPQNTTWSNAWLNENETYYDIASLNASVGTRVGFQFYANDTSDNEYESAVVSFLVEPSFAFNPTWFLAGGIVTLIIIGVVFIKKKGGKQSTNRL